MPAYTTWDTARSSALPPVSDDRLDYIESQIVTAGLQAITLTVVRANMIDNADATGRLDFAAGALPANALVQGWKAVTSLGFTGNVSATVQVGVAGTLAAFSQTTTGSVFAAGTVGSATPIATAYNVAASTPRVTVTGSSSFAAIVAGSMVVTLYYFQL